MASLGGPDEEDSMIQEGEKDPETMMMMALGGEQEEDEELKPSSKKKARKSGAGTSSSSSSTTTSTTSPTTKVASAFTSCKARRDAGRHDVQELQGEFDLHWGSLEEEWERLLREQEGVVEQYGVEVVNEDEVLELNVGGQPVDVRRSVLTQLEGTRLAGMFSGRWDKKLATDRHNR